MTTAIGGFVTKRDCDDPGSMIGPVTVYEVEDDFDPGRAPTYYFCCAFCGACSAHHRNAEATFEGALDHTLMHKEQR